MLFEQAQSTYIGCSPTRLIL